ncbi:unnamed protein product [Schistosoma margrebowiei]|uniref:Uncharacterized protein n=1 Tax=Schistosoma margrebowiei TaxID=48269 RepID=A0A183MNQ5_9TREM|nr:unnamed protein product [Schistosoma margrebowiei]
MGCPDNVGDRAIFAMLGISETHWTQAGQKILDSGEVLMYSGHDEENAPYIQRVALMLSKEWDGHVTNPWSSKQRMRRL